MIFPTGAVNDNIVQVRTSKVIKTIQQVVDHSLKHCRGTLKPKWHAPELKETEGSCEGSLLSISWGYWDLPVSLCEVNSGDEIMNGAPPTRSMSSSTRGMGYGSTLERLLSRR